jgi:hypothetical protein
MPLLSAAFKRIRLAPEATIIYVVVAGFGLEFDAWINLLRRSLSSMRNLDEKGVSKVPNSDGHRVKFLLSEERGRQADC